MQIDRGSWLKFTNHAKLAWVFALTVSSVLANQAIYKCGNEVTNQPLDSQNCRMLDISLATQIEGTRVQVPQNRAPSNGGSNTSSASSRTPEMQMRQAQSRTILEDEWQKLSAQYAEMVRLYNQGQPLLMPGESTHQLQYKQRVQDMKQQLQRFERDLQALNRELNRYAKNLPPTPLKSD